MHIRGGRGKSDIFGSEYCEVIFLGPNKAKTIFMIYFDTKHRVTDISGFARGNSDLYLHCLRIFHVHVQVFKYKFS